MRYVLLTLVMLALAVPAAASVDPTGASVAEVKRVNLDLEIKRVKRIIPRSGAFYSVKVSVVNRGPDAFPEGDLVVTLQKEVSDYEILNRRGVGACSLGSSKKTLRVRCPLGRLGLFDSASLVVRIRVPEELEGEQLVVVAGVLADDDAVRFVGKPLAAFGATVAIGESRPPARAWTGKWTTNYGCCFTTTQNPDGSVAGSWTYTGGGSLVDARVLDDGVTLTGRYTTRDFGNGTFTLKKTGPDSWSGSFTPDPGSPVGPGPWTGSRVP